MAQPSVAREPSMEEILASIRRIIESNEPASPDAFSAPLTSAYDDEEEEISFSAEIVSPPSHVPPAANQGYGSRQPETSFAERPEMAGAGAADKNMSLADVAARVRAAADRNASLGPQGYAAQRMAEPVPVSQPPFQQERAAAGAPIRPTDVRPLLNATQANLRPQAEPAPVFERPVVASPEPQPLPVWESMPLRGAVEPERAIIAPTPAPVQSPAPAQPEMMAAPQPVEPPLAAEPQQRQKEETGLSLNLISAAAGAQIAQSFGELAQMFDGVERPSVEEMAQDMLRPMLKDWLEDNLPTLVERLVREEIERVARGPRR